MKINLITLFYVLCLVNTLYSAFDLKPTNPLQFGSGNLSMSLGSNSVNIFSDPATVLDNQSFRVQVCSKSPFNISGLKMNHWSLYYPTKNWGWALGGSTFGDKIYKENVVSIVVGKKIVNKIDFGVTLNWYSLTIVNFGSTQIPGLTVSWNFPISEHWKWGTSLRNVIASKLGKSNEKLPQVVTSNLTANFNHRIFLFLEWEEDLNSSTTMRIGTRGKINSFLCIATGFETHSKSPTFGLTLNTKFGTIGYGFQYFPTLNRYTIQAGISFFPDMFFTN